MMAFEHSGFWQPMDTLRDKNLLEELWSSGEAPWKCWRDERFVEFGLSGRRVLVTGHTGFKGSWLCLWLHTLGAEVTGLALDPRSEPSHWDC